MKPHRGTLILVLGILSVVCCGLFTGLPAFFMGKADLAEMTAGQMDPAGQGLTKTGQIIGLIGTILSLIYGLGYAVMLVLGIGVAAAGAGAN
jgi:hypothetical protein